MGRTLTMLRRARFVLGGTAAAIVLALLAAHAPAVRGLVLRRTVDALRTSYGIDVRAASLSYNLLALSAEVRGIQVAAVATPGEPFALADAVAVSFGWPTLMGDVSVRRLSITSPRIDIRRRPDGSDNLPRVNQRQSNTSGMTLPPIRVDDLGVSFLQPSASATMHGATLQATGEEAGRISATIDAREGMTVSIGDRTIAVASATATLDLAGDRLDLRELTASRPGTELHAAGSVALRGNQSTVDLTFKASSDLESWWPSSKGKPGPVGRMDATARVTGAASDPTMRFETSSQSIAWGDIESQAIQARGSYRHGELSLDTIRLAVADGTVEAHGVITEDARGTSRIEARWTDIDLRRVPSAARLAGTVSKDGSAVVKWRPDGVSASPRVDVVATTGVIASGRTIPVVLEGSGRGNRWQLKAAPRDASIVDVTATADIGLDSRRWQASTIDGRLVLRTADLPAVIRLARDFGVAADIDESTATGTIRVDATLAGTLGAVRSTGRVTGRSVALARLPASDLDAMFTVDASTKTSRGRFQIVAPRLESMKRPSKSGLTVGGSLAAEGSWSGRLNDPVIDAAVSSKSVTIGGRDAGAITADITVAAGVAHVAARAPTLKMTLNVAIGLAAPNSFDGHAAVTDYDVDALLALAGVPLPEGGSVHGRVSSSIAFKGDLRGSSPANLTLEIAPAQLTAFDVPVVMNRPLRASLERNEIRFDDVAVAVGGLGVKLAGTLGTEGNSGTLLLDVDGDLASLTPWMARLSGGNHMSAVGRLTGHLEASASPAGILTTGTVNTAVSSLSRGGRILARDVRAAIVLTGQRAEVRDLTGSALGGKFSAVAGAPLVWLNQWLPQRYQIAPSSVDSPGVLGGTASFDLPALLDLLGRRPADAVAGGIDLSAKLSAPKPDLTAIAGEIRFDRAEASVRELTYAQSDVTRLRLANGALTIDSLNWHGPGSTISGRGSVDLLNGIESHLRLDVDTELAIVGALLSGRATGRLTGNVELSGPSKALRITSDATLSDASWLVPAQRILFAGWSGHVRLEDQALSISNLGGSVNGGSVRVDGRLPIEPGAGGDGLAIAARDILIDIPRGLHSQLGADLVWRRATGAAQLHGTIEVTANRYAEPVTRILQMVKSLASATRNSRDSRLPPWLASTVLDISLAVTDPIIIDNSVSTVELVPDLKLEGTIDSPALSGRVDVADNGRITIGGRAYRLRDSRVRFAPNDGLVPTVDVLGDTRIGTYDVTIRINGTPDRIDTSFSSVPPLGERDLQSLIVTGRTGEQTTTAQGRQSDDNFAAAAAATDILGFAGKFVGLDSVRVGASDLDLVSKDVNATQHLTVTKSLGAPFDLIFSENLEDGSLTWVVVWKPTPVNEIRASSVEDGTRALEFRRTLVFGPGSPGTNISRRAEGGQPRAIVDAVRITGTPGFSEKELVGKLAIDTGNRFDVRRWIDDRHRLEAFYLDRGYHRVRIASSRSESADRSHVSLTYDIQRGPRTVIDFTGDPLPGEVREAMYNAWRGLPIQDVVRAEFNRLAREGLARRGYYRPQVQIDFTDETADVARVTMNVARGPQVTHLTIAWNGNRDVANADLDALVAPHLAESPVWIDAESVAWQVKQLYASRGYQQAEVTVGEPIVHDTVATLPIGIDEGVLSRLASVRLEGVDPARTVGATEALGLAIGEPLAESAPVEAGRRLKAFYLALGYRSAAVTHTLATAKDGSVSIAWAVKEGPLYRVKDVNVVGVHTTNEGLVQKAISLAPGDSLSQGELDTTQRQLYDIGSFRRVDFDLGQPALQLPRDGELPVTLTVQAEEPQRFQLKYGVQFSVDRSAGSAGGTAVGASVELRDRNFIGRAVQASIGAHWDTDLQTVAMLLSSPRFFGKPVRTNVYARYRLEQQVLDESTLLEGATLDDRRREGTFEQRWRPASAWELVWGFSLSYRRFLIDRDDQHVDTGGLLAGPAVSVIFDRRDSPFDATRGQFHSSSIQFGVPSLGSDLRYFRYLLRESYYQPLGKVTAAASVRYGTIQRYSGTTPPSIIDLLFDAGGTNSVRGYPEDSLSAINLAGFALGGTDLVVLNGELRFPISKRLGGAAFVDAGNTFASIADVRLGELAVGAGLGVRIRTPLAPLRLDIAHPFSKQYGQGGIRVHFSIGQMF